MNMINKQVCIPNSSYLYYICLDKKDCEYFTGNIYPAGTKDRLKFHTFGEFIIKMEDYMDKNGPQSFQDKRSLTKTASKSKYVLPNTRKKMAHSIVESAYQDAYQLYIYSRRNTEWQGVLYYKDEVKLEFSNIIDLTSFFSNF